jgi:TetR/AcrR family transcriptional regulator, cholesterol catabolism regulator
VAERDVQSKKPSKKASTPAKKTTAAKTTTARRGTRTAGAPLDGGRARDREVIETAVRIFWEKGYAGASVQDVADALGMLKGSLYYYIDSKESLLLKIFEDSHNEITELTQAASSSDGRAVDRLATYLHEYAIWTLTHLERAGLFAREWRYAAEPVRSSLAERVRFYDRVLRGLITEGQEQGDIPAEVDPRRASVFIWAAFTSLPDWYRPGRVKPEEVADEYVALALRTVGARRT